MSTDRDVDHLLPDGHPPPDRLAALLAAAAAPARPGELAGEQDVMVAFRRARLDGSPAPRRRPMIRLAFAKLLTVKVAAGAAAATVAGGVALAATGTMPGPLAGLGAGELRPAPAVSATDHPGEGGSSGIGPASAPASPSPSLAGLCEAYQAEVADAPGRALDNPAFRALIAAAGGEDEVDEFCVELTPRDPGDVPRVEPSAVPVPLPPVDPGPPGDRVVPPPGPPDR